MFWRGRPWRGCDVNVEVSLDIMTRLDCADRKGRGSKIAEVIDYYDYREPAPLRNGRKYRIYIPDPEVCWKIEEIHRRTGKTYSEIIRRLIEIYLEVKRQRRG